MALPLAMTMRSTTSAGKPFATMNRASRAASASTRSTTSVPRRRVFHAIDVPPRVGTMPCNEIEAPATKRRGLGKARAVEHLRMSFCMGEHCKCRIEGDHLAAYPGKCTRGESGTAAEIGSTAERPGVPEKLRVEEGVQIGSGGSVPTCNFCGVEVIDCHTPKVNRLTSSRVRGGEPSRRTPHPTRNHERLHVPCNRLVRQGGGSADRAEAPARAAAPVPWRSAPASRAECRPHDSRSD
jgi:hypothetical protein